MSIKEKSTRADMFLGLFLVVRGAPVFLYRKDLANNERLPFALYCGTALPLVVALTNIGVASAGMSVEIATAMVGAAVLSVLLFPAIAQALLSTSASEKPNPPRSPLRREKRGILG